MISFIWQRDTRTTWMGSAVCGESENFGHNQLAGNYRTSQDDASEKKYNKTNLKQLSFTRRSLLKTRSAQFSSPNECKEKPRSRENSQSRSTNTQEGSSNAQERSSQPPTTQPSSTWGHHRSSHYPAERNLSHPMQRTPGSNEPYIPR